MPVIKDLVPDMSNFYAQVRNLTVEVYLVANLGVSTLRSSRG